MAISFIGAEAAAVSGPYSTTSSITINLPSGTQAGDILHLAVGVMSPNVTTVYNGAILLLRAYSFAIPPGWNLVLSSGPELRAAVPLVTLLRKTATSADINSGSVVIPVTQSIHDARHGLDDDHLDVVASITSHRGADPLQWLGPFGHGLTGFEHSYSSSFEGGTGQVTRRSPARPRVESPNDAAVQFSFITRRNLDNAQPVPPITPTVETDPEPPITYPGQYSVLAQGSTLAPAAAGSAFRGAALEAMGVPTDPGTILRTPISLPGTGMTTGDHHGLLTIVLQDSEGRTVDAPPEPGQIGVTGSGWLVPEWAGRDKVLDTPLLCEVLAEDGDGELIVLLSEEEAFPPVALDAMFTGLGVCTTAVAQFPAPTGLTPYEHALRFRLRTAGQPEEDQSPAWWTGVVTNVREEGGLYHVDLEGFWSLSNEARVSLEEVDPEDPETEMQIGTPSLPGIILDTLILNNGDYRAKEIKVPADEQQSWSDHLNAVFRETPAAAWGVGPDQTFVMGLPENGGALLVDARSDLVTKVVAGEFLLPPFVTQWWAVNSDGTLMTGNGLDRGLLAPNRVTEAQLDGDDNLLVPKESQYLSYEGPSHVLEVAGIAVPPLQVVNLPGGEMQMVASARVQVTLGEEGSMPRVTTTLTTVALPYERRR